MATEKAPNFTVEQVDRLREVYGASVEANDDYDARKVVVESLAAEFDKKPNSIIAKLSNMDIYVSKVKAVSAVTGMMAQKKDAMAERVSELIEANYERPDKVGPINPETLAKSNKTDLALLIRVLEFAFPESEETPETEGETVEVDETT